MWQTPSASTGSQMSTEALVPAVLAGCELSSHDILTSLTAHAFLVHARVGVGDCLVRFYVSEGARASETSL